MLVFTCKKGEGIVIGDEITVTILENEDGQVQLGVNSPKGFVVLKEETYRRIIKTGKGELVEEVHRVA